jgi:NADH-quinone oxidoreductase subunit D
VVKCPKDLKTLVEQSKRNDDFSLRVKKLIFDNAVVKKRAVGTGYVDPSWVDRFGVVGPNARAAGVNRDVRKDYPYLKYAELDFEPYVDENKGSDVYSRFWVRYMDMINTVALIRQILDKMPNDGKSWLESQCSALVYPKRTNICACESSRGEYGFYAVSDGLNTTKNKFERTQYTHAIALLENC